MFVVGAGAEVALADAAAETSETVGTPVVCGPMTALAPALTAAAGSAAGVVVVMVALSRPADASVVRVAALVSLPFEAVAAVVTDAVSGPSPVFAGSVDTLVPLPPDAAK